MRFAFLKVDCGGFKMSIVNPVRAPDQSWSWIEIHREGESMKTRFAADWPKAAENASPTRKILLRISSSPAPSFLYTVWIAVTHRGTPSSHTSSALRREFPVVKPKAAQ